MNSQTKICQNCHQDFTIEPEDFDFYKKIDVPAPTWCPECRNMRRMAWREQHILYHGVCALCHKQIITIHHPNGPFKIYCRECYRSDKWDPISYGQDYDFSRPFFAQYRELMEAVPRPALTGTNLVNSEFTHGCESVKNCYLVFFSYYSEYSQNCYALLLSKNSYDCYVVDNSDQAYDSLHCNRLYRVGFGYFSDDCIDCRFLYDCVGCSDCFGCINLRKQKYCIFNQQFTKDEYRSKIKYWDLGSYARLEEAKNKFRDLYIKTPHRYAHVVNSHNVTGDVIRDAKDCQSCFSALDGVQNCKYLYFGGLNLKDSMDVSGGGDTSDLLYEIFGVTGNASRCFLSVGGSNSHDTWYCDWANNSSYVFGCISIWNKRYCILNKQYSKNEYEVLVTKIRRQMSEKPYVDKKGRVYTFGEFFPTELSAYAYNETFGFPWYPKTKSEVLEQGWQWQDQQRSSHKITLETSGIPDHIKNVTDAILNEIISCAHSGDCNEQCTGAFRISKEELEFYRQMNLALPRLCSNCRYAERLKWRNGFTLWKRNCMCNKTKHFHSEKNCPNEFETTFSPQKSEILYCDKCYKAEYL